MSLHLRMLGAMHHALARNRAALWLARKLHNQLSAVITSSLNDGIDPERNGESWLAKRVAPDSSFFIDVGANTGVWTKAFIRYGPSDLRGLAFEPSPEAFASLVEGVCSGIDSSRISFSNKAVSDTPGRMDFYCEAGNGETSSLIERHSSSSATMIPVEVTTIDEEVRRMGVEFVDMLKVDAEGFDLKAIKGASGLLAGKRVGVVQFEYNRPWAYAGSTLYDAKSFLEGHGYRVYLLLNSGLVDLDYERYGEYFHYSNYVALAPSHLHLSGAWTDSVSF